MGETDGPGVGAVVGAADGTGEGAVVGAGEGAVVGLAVGCMVGGTDGAGVGFTVGFAVGCGVGIPQAKVEDAEVDLGYKFRVTLRQFRVKLQQFFWIQPAGRRGRARSRASRERGRASAAAASSHTAVERWPHRVWKGILGNMVMVPVIVVGVAIVYVEVFAAQRRTRRVEVVVFVVHTCHSRNACA